MGREIAGFMVRTVWAGTGAAVRVVAVGVDVHAALSVGVVALDIP